MKTTFRKVSIISVLVSIILPLFYSACSSGHKENSAMIAYKKHEYSGVIVNKFIDKEQHLYQKIIINQDNQEDVIVMNFEAGGLYDFLCIGDSISKTSGSLKVRVVRNDMDTIIKMKFIKRR